MTKFNVYRVYTKSNLDTADIAHAISDIGRPGETVMVMYSGVQEIDRFEPQQTPDYLAWSDR